MWKMLESLTDGKPWVRWAVISLWLSSPQIYRLLISASPTLMESQARSFELSAIYAFSFHNKENAHTQPVG